MAKMTDTTIHLTWDKEELADLQAGLQEILTTFRQFADEVDLLITNLERAEAVVTSPYVL